LPRCAKTLTPFIAPQGTEGAKKTGIGTGGRIIAKKAEGIAGTGTGVDVRKTNNETGLAVSTAPKEDVTAAVNAVIIEGKPGNAKTRGVKAGTELFKTKIVIRLRHRLALGLIGFCSRKPKIIKFIKILLRVR